ncbi:MAG: STAS domain-containing protein [Phycisphaeraceae bacterium]
MAGVTEQRHGAVAVIKPDGPCIQEQAQALNESALPKVRPMMGRVVIDLSASAYVDSLGLETLLDLSDAMENCGQTLRLAGVSATVREVLDLTGLTNRFEFHDDTNLAVRSFL